MTRGIWKKNENKPAIPRCNCGQVTEWTFDPDDEIYYASQCWRCLEIQWMLDPDNSLKRSLTLWGTDRIDRFLEIITDDTIFKSTIEVIKFDNE